MGKYDMEPLRVIDTYCELPFRRLVIEPNGDTSNCCLQERGCLGNVLRQSIGDVWKNVKGVQNGIVTGSLHPACDSLACPYYSIDKRIHRNVEEYDGPVELEIHLPMQNCHVGGMRPTEEHPACLGCERQWGFKWQEDRTFEICVKTKSLMSNIKLLSVQGVAEPFYQDAIFNVLRWLNAQDFRDKMLLHTTTSGVLLEPVVRYRYLWYDHSFLMVSLSAGTSETYSKICRLDAFDKVVENIRAYVAERKPETQKIALHNHINLLNVDEVEMMVMIAAELHVDFVEFDASYEMPGLMVDESNVGRFREAQRKIVEKGKELGFETRFLRNLYLTLGPG